MKRLLSVELAAPGFFRSFVDSSLDCVKVLELDGRLRFMNQTGQALMDIDDIEPMLGQSWVDIWAPEDQATVRAALAKAAGGESVRFTLPAFTMKGAYRHWENLISPLWGEDGQIIGLMATSRDVTEQVREKAASELRERELQRHATALRTAGRIAKVGGWEVDYVAGTATFSDEFWELLAVEPQGQVWVDTALPTWSRDDAHAFGNQLWAAVSKGQRFHLEGRVKRGDGQKIWLRMVGEPVMENGVCIAARGVAQDISEEREVLRRLQQAQTFAQGMIDGMAAHLCVVNAGGQVIAANKAWTDQGVQQGRAPGYPVGVSIYEILAGLQKSAGDPLRRDMEAVLSGRRQGFTRTFNSPMPGGMTWFKAQASLFENAGQPLAVIVVQNIDDVKRPERRLRDLNRTLRKARDEADAANTAKSAFLATMSHEIRTPLNGVLGMTQAMAKDELSDVQRQRLDVIRQSGEALLVLLNDILDLSKIESGRLQLEDGVVDTELLADRALSAFTALAGNKDIAFSVSVAPAARGCWKGDPTRVRQVLYNLIGNAVKFTERGSITVAISRRGRRLYLKVTDSGIGIPPARMPTLFDKFVQADTSTTRRFGGTGLGLSICRELSALMGGRVTAASVEGRGSTFTVELPAVPADITAVLEHVTVIADPTPPDPGLRILAAEDNVMNQLVLRTLLEQLGVHVTLVANGAEALDAWSKEPFDLILMDVQMPVMDGPTAVRELRRRERRSGQSRTPIIALTANAMAHHREEYLAAGMDALVAKPIELSALIQAIESVCGVEETGVDALRA